MSNANARILNELIRHQVYVLRLIARQQDDFVNIITKGNPELRNFLVESLENIDVQFTKTNLKKWKVLKESIFNMRMSTFNAFKDEYKSELLRTIKGEINYINALYKDSIGIKEVDFKLPTIPASNLLEYGVFDGKSLEEYFTNLAYGDSDRIVQTVRSGIINGKERYKIVNELIGSKKLDYKDGVINSTRNNARSIVRTVSMGIVNSARDEFHHANSDIIKQEIFVATLDGRTTMECLSLDGTIFLVGEGEIPPLHRACRSLRSAIIDGIALLGERPYITDTRTRRVREIDFRKEAKEKSKNWSELTEKDRRVAIKVEREAWIKDNIGTVPATTTADTWLRNQDVKFQNEVLGIKQAELFRNSDFKLSKFVDLSGKKMTVEELYGLYPDLFEKYGIPYNVAN